MDIAITNTPPKWQLWTGRVLSALPVLLMLMGVVMNFTHNPQAVAGNAHFGYQESAMLTVGILALVSVVLYVIPQTAVFGAIVMTGYFGGAIATHIRISDPGWPAALVCGVLVWAGLWLRDTRLRALLPLRRG